MSTQDELKIELVSAPGGGLVVRVSGELDMATSPQLLDAVPEFTQALGHPPTSGRVVFDLADVTFIDSSGIGALLECRRTFNDLGAEFGITGLQSSPRRALGITGVLGLLEISPSDG